MKISDYIECINKAFEAKYKDKGFFVVTYQYVNTPFPIYKKLNVKIIHIPSNEEVFTFTFLDKVPTGKELEFEDRCLLEIITTITYKIELIWHYGESNV